MLQALKAIDLTRENSHYGYGSANDITINKLKENEYRDTNIKIENYCDHFNGYYSSIGIFTYIGFQALSKILRNPLNMSSRQTRSPDIYLTRDMENYISERTNVVDYHIDFMAIAPSNITRSCIKNKRNEFGTTNQIIDDGFAIMSDAHILGTTISNDKHNVLIYINLREAFTVLYQIMALTIAFRLLDKVPKNDLNADVYNLFEEIAKYFANKNHKQLAESSYNYPRLKEIFINYITGLDEYTIDQSNELKNILTKIKEKRYNNLKIKAETAQRNLTNALNNLSSAQKEYDLANSLYTAALLVTTEQTETQLQEAIDLMKRSNRIIEHGLDGTKLWFTMLQPLAINDKTEWERISSKLFSDKHLELINKTLIDEKFQLWTECTVAFDFDTSRIERYGPAAQLKTQNAIPHPHVGLYGCFGQHQNIIGNLIAQGDYLGAIEQTIEAGSGLNWSDGPVTTRFSKGFNTNYIDIKCFFDKENEKWFSLNEYLHPVDELELKDSIDETNN